MSHDEPKILNLGDLLREADRQREEARASRTIDASSRAIGQDTLAEVTKQRDEFARYIAERTGGLGPDWACAKCKPGSDMLVAGFVCVFHRAEAIVAGRRA